MDKKRARPVTDESGETKGVVVFCPACQHGHLFNTTPARPGGPVWTFNGDFDRPTFSPSMLTYEPMSDGTHRTICHSFVRDGKIEFLSDCAHSMRGKTVELPEF